VALATLSLNTPILIGAGVFLALGLGLALTMPETHFHRTPSKPFHSMARTLAQGSRLVRRSPVLIILLLLAAILGMASEGFDRLWTPHLLQAFTFPTIGGLEPIVWFGIIRGGGLLLAIGATELARRTVDTSDGQAVARTLFAVDALRIGATVAFALAGDFVVAVAAFWARTVLSRVHQPIYSAWLNQQLESESRATVLSMSGQLDALGQIVGGPAVGALAVSSIRAALVVTAAAMTPALFLYARARHLLRGAATLPD
jgi:hypothetical protein